MCNKLIENLPDDIKKNKTPIVFRLSFRRWCI